MKITLGEAVNYYNVLAEVTNAKLKLPARLSAKRLRSTKRNVLHC